MDCPVDGTKLVVTERSGIEIDYCPQCRGVWLDRGELDKIVERAAAEAPRPTVQPTPRDRDYDTDRYHPRSGAKEKRGGFLGELFDFSERLRSRRFQIGGPQLKKRATERPQLTWSSSLPIFSNGRNSWPQSARLRTCFPGLATGNVRNRIPPRNCGPAAKTLEFRVP